jgi:hypothetical protein
MRSNRGAQRRSYRRNGNARRVESLILAEFEKALTMIVLMSFLELASLAALYGFRIKRINTGQRLDSSINWDTLESAPTGSTKTIAFSLRIILSGACHSLPRFTRTLVTAFVSAFVTLCT